MFRVILSFLVAQALSPVGVKVVPAHKLINVKISLKIKKKIHKPYILYFHILLSKRALSLNLLKAHHDAVTTKGVYPMLREYKLRIPLIM